MTQAIANNAASGCFMNKSYANITDILDRLTTHSQAWHSSNSDGLSLGTPLIQNIVKDSQETQQTLAQLATSLSLLTKRLDERESKKVNVCEDISGMPPGMYQCQEGPYQEGPPQPVENVQYADYVAKGDVSGPNQRYWRPQQGQGAYNQGNYNNNQGNYNNNYGGPNQGRYNNNNGNFGNRSSNPYIPPKGQSNDQGSSRLESMLEKVLASQTNTEKTLSGLSETVVSHSAAIQNLEQQMRDLSREQHPARKGGLPSDTIPNPKNGGGVERTFAISTRSGKILQGADKKVVDLDPIIEEEEVHSDVPIIDDEVHGEEKVVDIPEVAADTRKHTR
ncbi:eukaryotic peptide chain release factor GTP-binding subunit-like [Lycium ferocissimum]|uniref:eukaryotic peptide chain release factor GTP-binding subunit-like n=1 Tax=Lycium ferocissimum TaxID=112874 RepID=UPI0028157C2A|nr:eukaryotic peptide chain release factor GTP-binding subunit-like [Lycium ferocissimum]